MKNIQTFDEFLNESLNSSSKVFIQQNSLWISYKPNSGSTTQIKGNPDEFNGYFTNNEEDEEHYNSDVNVLIEWSKLNKPEVKKSNSVSNYVLYKIPCWWGYKDHHELSIWGGDIKPEYYIWLSITTMKNGMSLVDLFKTKQHALGFLK